MLDLAGTKAGECALVLGPRDARGADGALDIDDGSPNRRPSLSRRKLSLGRHTAELNWLVRMVWEFARCLWSPERVRRRRRERGKASSLVSVVGSGDKLQAQQVG
jgi:hypothetical protein